MEREKGNETGENKKEGERQKKRKENRNRAAFYVAH
jgi:hypothetical protein